MSDLRVIVPELRVCCRIEGHCARIEGLLQNWGSLCLNWGSVAELRIIVLELGGSLHQNKGSLCQNWGSLPWLEGHIVRFVRYGGRGGMPKIPLSVLCNCFEGKFASLILSFPCEMCANEPHFQTTWMFVLKRITEEFNNFFIDLWKLIHRWFFTWSYWIWK